MIRQLLRNGQITLPKKAINFFHLQEEDLLNIDFDASGIHLKPLLVEELSKEEYDKLAKKLNTLKQKNTKGKVFTTVAKARQHLNKLSNKK